MESGVFVCEWHGGGVIDHECLTYRCWLKCIKIEGCTSSRDGNAQMKTNELCE